MSPATGHSICFQWKAWISYLVLSPIPYLLLTCQDVSVPTVLLGLSCLSDHPWFWSGQDRSLGLLMVFPLEAREISFSSMRASPQEGFQATSSGFLRFLCPKRLHKASEVTGYSKNHHVHSRIRGHLGCCWLRTQMVSAKLLICVWMPRSGLPRAQTDPGAWHGREAAEVGGVQKSGCLITEFQNMREPRACFL